MAADDSYILRRIWLSFCIGAAVSSALVGCGVSSDRAKVSGTLHHSDGSPIVAARVIARSKEGGKSVTGLSDGEGWFQLTAANSEESILPGSYQIGVVEDRGDMDNRRPPTISMKYMDPSTSGIEFRVEAGESKGLELKLDPPG